MPYKLAEHVLAKCRKQKLKIATAESCTGGLIAAALTDIPGSSDVIECGFITYSNQAKMDILSVPDKLLEYHGAVSKKVAMAMAEGALLRSNADIAVAVTGVAGPAGGTDKKPVGTVHIAVAEKERVTKHAEHRFSGDRIGIRKATVRAALRMIEEMVS